MLAIFSTNFPRLRIGHANSQQDVLLVYCSERKYFVTSLHTGLMRIFRFAAIVVDIQQPFNPLSNNIDTYFSYSAGNDGPAN